MNQWTKLSSQFDLLKQAKCSYFEGFLFISLSLWVHFGPHFPILREVQHPHTHTLKHSPAGVLPGEAEMSLLPSLSGVSVSSPPGGISSFLILLVVGLKAWRSTPLDLSTVIILTSTPQHLYPLEIPNFIPTSLSLPYCLCPSFTYSLIIFLEFSL